MSVFTLHANMTRGEVTPYVHARVDTDHYQAGLQTAKNVVVLRYGGVMRVPGTIYRGPAKNANKTARGIPFEFNRTQVYNIEAGELYFRFWTSAGRIESPPGTPVEVVTPYLEADLRYIQVRQSADVLYVFCRGYQPQILKRLSDTSWTLTPYVPQDGPYLPVNLTSTTMTPALTGAVHPKMTSNTLPSGTVSSTALAAGSGGAFSVFDFDKSTYAQSSSTTLTLSYTFGGGVTKACDAYYIRAITFGNPVAPVTWDFQGFDGTNWITLDSRSNQTGWGRGETRYFTFVNATAYQAYQIVVAGSEDTASVYIAEMGWHENGDTMTPFNLTASSIVGINATTGNTGTGFQAGDVGRPIRLQGKDGIWRWAAIAAVVSTTVVTVRLYNHALPDTSPIVNWRLGAWSNQTGWPSSVAIYEDRLIGARTDTDPLGVWGSVNAAYTSFRSSAPAVDDDAISARLTGGKLNDIGWMLEGKDIIAGTAGSLRSITHADPNKALSPTNVKQRAETITPSSRAEPIAIDNVLLFLDVYEQRLYEASFTWQVDGYITSEVSTLNEHLFASKVQKIVYLSSPHRLIMCLRYDGKLVAFTYDRDQKVTGGTLIDVGGTVEDISPLPGTLGTDLWMVVNRTVNGATVRYVETLAEFWRTAISNQVAPIYGAAAVTYSGAATNVVTGVNHLLNTTVGVLADGRDLGDVTVSGTGTVTLPAGLTASTIVIGLRMPWQITTLRLAQIGNKDGSGLGRKVSIVDAMIDLFESAGVVLGSLDVQDPLGFEDEVEQDPMAATTLRTGMFNMRVDDSWKNNGQCVIKGDRMYPATVRGIQLEVEGEP